MAIVMFDVKKFVADQNNDKLKLLEEIVHEYPPMEDAEFARLKDDIQKNGILQPLLAVQRANRVLIYDGRNRFQAINELISEKIFDETKYKIPIEIENNTKDEDLRMKADSYNISRRHLTSKQKSVILFSERFDEMRKEIEKKATRKNRSIDGFVELVGKTNRTYAQKWKNIYQFLTKEKKTELLKELSRYAYENDKNFDAITELYRLADKAETMDTIQTINLLEEIKAGLADGKLIASQIKAKYKLATENTPDTSKPAKVEITIKIAIPLKKENRDTIKNTLAPAIQEAMANATINGPYKLVIISIDNGKDTKSQYNIEELEE